jgi:outer membrane protein TolC
MVNNQIKLSLYFRCIIVFLSVSGIIVPRTVYSQGTGQDLPVSADERSLSIEQVLRLAEKASPGLKAYVERETQSKAVTGIQSAYLYPHLDAAGVDSTGFPGSGSPTPYGFGGLVSSPYREGTGIDISGTWTLFDANLKHKATASHYQELSSRAQTYITRMRVDEQALELYFNTALYRGQKETWNEIVEKFKPIINTVKRFVRIGRYNEVELLLLQNQQDEAKLTADTYDQQYQGNLKRLSLALGLTSQVSQAPVLQVPGPSHLSEQSLAAIGNTTQNPLLDYAQSEVKVSKAIVDSASAARMPRLYVTGSVGAMDSTRLVSNSDYSGWAGISVPVFEGFSLDNEEKRARASYREKNDLLSATQLQVDDLNAQYDQTIQTAQMKITELAPRYEQAQRNFLLAKDRYLNFLGTVTELEESLKNLALIEAETNNARMDLLLAQALKKLSNGGTLKE